MCAWNVQKTPVFLSPNASGASYKIFLILLRNHHRKSLIQHCERSELRLHFEWTKVACGQTVLPVLIGQKLVENAKIKKSTATF